MLVETQLGKLHCMNRATANKQVNTVAALIAGVHVRSLVWEQGKWLVLDGKGALIKVDLPQVRPIGALAQCW